MPSPDYIRVPYVRPAYEPQNTVTLLQLMQMARAAQSSAASQRGRIQSEAYGRIGDAVMGTIDRAQARQEQRRLEGLEAQRYRDQQAAARQQFDVMEREREADRADRAQLRQRQSAIDAISSTPAGPIGADSAAAIRAYAPTSGLIRDQQTLPARVTPGAYGEMASAPQAFSVRAQTPEELARAETFAAQRAQAEAAAEARRVDDARLREQLEETKRHNQALERGALTRSGPRPLTEGQRVQLTNQLVKQWTTAVKPYRDIQRQVTMMEAGIDAARRGDLAAGNEAVLQTFLKVLDPNSVVREGEFWRLQQGQSFISRARAAVQRIQDGGWVPLPELEKYARLARDVETAIAKHHTGARARIQRTAESYDIGPELIFDVDPESLDEASFVPPPGGGGASAAMRPAASHADPLTVTAPNGMTFRFNSPEAAAGFRARLVPR